MALARPPSAALNTLSSDRSGNSRGSSTIVDGPRLLIRPGIRRGPRSAASLGPVSQASGLNMNAQHARSGLVSHLGHVVFAVLALIGLNLVPARAQQAPPNGPPPNPPRVHALTNARVVVAPGNV